MLQEEIAARKSHWRRVRQKEAELITLERKLTNQLLFNFDTIKVNALKKQISAIEEVRNKSLFSELGPLPVVPLFGKGPLFLRMAIRFI